MQIKEHAALKALSTFRIGGPVSYFAELRSLPDVIYFSRFAEEKSLPFIPIGGGSNVIFPDEDEFSACVGKMEIKGFEIISQSDAEAIVKIGAGEIWDEIVARAVSLGLSGIEALSAIPGTAGATPVQNVGAYGQEIAQTLIELEAYDLKNKQPATLLHSACGFSYRESKFKSIWKGRYVITSITLRLLKESPKMPAYPGVEAYFSKAGIFSPTLAQIREAVIQIRKKKLPDPKDIASCGSFFKNPMMSQAEAMRLISLYQGAVTYPLADGRVKVAAGWLIDHLGFKGRQFGEIEVYPENALVLINRGNATRKELLKAVSSIQKEVKAAFGVELEPEVVWIA